jgi:pimeloyl-ACP methyl ester carboxylesterase
VKHLLLLSALLLFACTDSPTSSDLSSATGSDLRTLPTGTPDGCPSGTTGASGTLPGTTAVFLICVPAGFDPATGSLVVYAHGAVPPQAPLAIPDDELGGLPVATIVTGSLNMAYATTSYRENGLVVVDAEKDIARLVAKFRELYGPIGGQTYGVGASEGGLIVTLATERHPQLFDGTLALCAPIGDFQRQINYFDDFRLAFDFFFQSILTPLGIVLGSPIDIPPAVIAAFGTPTNPGPLALTIANLILTDPAAALAANHLLAQADIAASTPAEAVEFILRLLAYNILYTNQVQDVLGGQPYDNVAETDYERVIDGLPLPPELRFQADQPALSHLRAKYETSGGLMTPLVTLYNVSDPIVPSWHEEIYRAKVVAAGTLEFLIAQIGVARFGHCDFTAAEVLGAFETLRTEVTAGARDD